MAGARQARLVALIGAIATLAPAAAGADVDVVVVNAVPGATGVGTVDALRPALVRAGQPGLDEGVVRFALEATLPDPVDPTVELRAIATERVAAFDAYAAFQYRAALAAITSAEAAAIALLPSAGARAELGHLTLLRAQIHLQQKKSSLAATDFRLAATLRDKAPLDPGLHAPNVVEAYDRAQSDTRTPARLTVAGVAGATVNINGVLVASWPASLPAGRAYLVVSRPGFAPDRRAIDLTVGDNRVDSRLDRLPITEQIHQRRRAIMSAPEPDRTELAVIAGLVGAKRLLLVVPEGSGHGVRVFNTIDGSITPKKPATEPSIRELLLTNLDPRVVVRNRRPEGPGIEAQPSWPRRHRTALLISGGVALAVVGVISTVVLTSGSSSGRALDRFCGLGVPCSDSP